MSALKSCIATKDRCHIEHIDIGVGEEMLLADLLLRVKSKRDPLATKPGILNLRLHLNECMG